MPTPLDRRMFLRATAVAGGTAAFAGALWHQAFAGPAQPGTGPYGALLAADANGLQLPQGFSSRIVARSMQRVAGTRHTWHPAPDGGACFPDGAGWIYVSNSEVPLVGGVSAIRFGADGAVTSAYRTLNGTTLNCAGGATPWNTWLSCEEHDAGLVYETDPYGQKSARSHPAMGRFKHEAAACDPDRKVVYLTEDQSDGCFYRFRPSAWGDLSRGTLEVLLGTGTGPVRWEKVPNPQIWITPTRDQVAGAMRFDGGEGCYYAGGVCYFTTKGDNRVWAYDAAAERLDLAYDDDLVTGAEPTLKGVDNITGAASGDLFVAEDGDDMEINLITPDGTVAPFVRVVGHDESEITGPAFSPDGTRLYFSSQRGQSGFIGGTDGVTYEVTGPFRR
ncbi:alkaline phosphatase PhoX [Actinomadura viridis]|uniref:Secreted PhoX family phosphatase n=1 Tax=Actinomadura viridis TaxID=58110 RepID=A0A931DFJ8_9ACTN|nr:alkaline phosphatase PhoX [Actinomadura viridis]MBG6090209.1 secreted PhoX family phosphatase [Actinomadura viridis]